MSESLPQLDAIVTDRYRIERQIGQGGMATVYLAEDLKLERQVALKVLRPELGAVLGDERFLAEVKITAKLDHPHILTLIDSGSAGGLLYYVLPYVRGESLRDLLDREHQLSLEQSLMITKHIASALEYAHRKGIVHRDIKPENILLQEGEAMLADFGIALAVQESGGSRLTETGLSLGTPHYMSPEQATGDRQLDARSDLYSLASVLYEMLVGEPPMTGKTVQSVVAKLLTETPMRVRTVRNTVPQHVDDAIARALSKVPADRFTSVADFSRALDTPSGSVAASTGASIAMPSATAPRSKRTKVLFAVAGVAVLGTIIGALIVNGTLSGAESTAKLRDRTQLTFTGKVLQPTLSADGKQLAYFTKQCTGAECRYSVEVQDVGSTNARVVLEGATAAYDLGWSPDRRNLLVYATINGRYGSFIASALGGAPRYLTAGTASFYANGDSLLLGPVGASETDFVVRVAGLDGTVRDSIRVPGPGAQLGALIPIPESSRFVAMVIQSPRGLWQVVDRSGKVTDKVLNTCTCGGVASRDALWMSRAGPSAAEAVVRVSLDPASGKLGTVQDTIYSGRFTNLSVTADGRQMMVDDGSYTFSNVAAPVAALIGSAAADLKPILEASSPIAATVSPDGSRLSVVRVVPGPNGEDANRVSVMPFEGGAETPLNLTGAVVGVRWVDSVTVLVRTRLDKEVKRFSLVDIRTGSVGRSLDLADSVIRQFIPLPTGWAWVPNQANKIILEQNGARREVVLPKWFDAVSELDVSPDGSRLLVSGWSVSTQDTVRVDVLPLSGGGFTEWTRTFAERGLTRWRADGTILFAVWKSSDAVSLFSLPVPGQSVPIGSIGRSAWGLSLSADASRATVMTRELNADAWMYQVVKP